MIASVILIVSIILSLPVLAAGSALIGWWVTRFLIRRVRIGRLLLFSMVGCLMGLIATLVIIAGIVIFSSHPLLERPRGIAEWTDAALIASIPVAYLTLAGFVAGAHATRSEQTTGAD